MTLSDGGSSPSAARRQALRDADASNSSSVYRVIETFPVESYFEMTKRLLKEFEASLDCRNLDAAYIYGIRFATFSLEVLPKHKGYKNATQLRQVNAKQVEQVLLALEDVTARMDAEEVVAAKELAERDETNRRRQEEEEAKRRQMEEEKERDDKKETRQERIQKSAMAKLLALQQTSQRDVATRTGSVATPQQPAQQQQPQPAKPTTNAALPSKQRSTSSRSPQRNPPKSTSKKSTSSALDSLPSMTMQLIDSASSNYDNNKSSSSQSIMSDGLCPDEERTIRLLQTTIAMQEARVPALERTADQLRAEAKEYLAQSKRKSAIGRLAQRKRILKAAQAAKTSIFTMETQIMRIEAAASDRDVQIAMRKASDTMASLQYGTKVGSSSSNNKKEDDDDVVSSVQHELDELAEVNHALANTDLLDTFDEDSLLRELLGEEEQEGNYEGPVRVDSRNSGLLSLPSLPNSPVMAVKAKQRKEKKQPIMATIV
jgi:Snf7